MSSKFFDQVLCRLFKAYRDAERHKRKKPEVLEFYSNLGVNLYNLAKDLVNRTYQVSYSSCFIINKPVKREVVAASFRDRVVHHFLFALVNPIFERYFINDSYSCRKGKGTLYGIRRAEGFMRSVTDNFTQKAYVLKMDVKGFFMNIDRDILFEESMSLLSKFQETSGNRNASEVLSEEWYSLVTYLLKIFVYHDPLENCIFKSPRSAWNGLPPDKSLIGKPINKGLPIGNLTSQLFSNVYLNPLDQFVKRELKIKYYGRYVDDFFLMSKNREELVEVRERIGKFLESHLKLRLHEKKCTLQDTSKGLPFVGAFILPYRTYAGRRLQNNFKCLIREAAISKTAPNVGSAVEQCPHLRESLVSYMGLLGNFDSFRFVRNSLLF